jgi:glycosyltransferase involved in cell wall biosynthesis
MQIKKFKITYITNHPAPYMDIIFDAISDKYELSVMYNNLKDSEKTWRQQINTRGILIRAKNLWKVVNILKTSSLIIIGGWNSASNLIIIMYLLFINKKFAIHTDVPDVNRITKFKKILKNFFFKRLDYLFITGESGIDHFKNNYNVRNKIFKILPYGVRVPDLHTLKDINRLRNSKLNAGDRIKILIANRFLARKGYDVLFDALNDLRSKNLLKYFEITIAGAGELFEEYHYKLTSLGGNITVLGWIEYDDYLKLMKSTDLYIHSSHFEPYGIPVIDAMVHGKLVIASNGVMSAVDCIESNVNGYIYNSHNSSELSNIMSYLNLNRIKIYEIGGQALNIRNKFSYRAYLDVIEECLIGQ